MNPYIMAGTIVVNLALVAYSIGIIAEQRKHLVTGFVLTFMSIGIIFDISATIMMTLGSSKSPFTPHGILGYTAFAGMLITTILFWRLMLGKGRKPDVPKGTNLFARFAYIWWLVAYVTGVLMAVLRHSK
ncbi:MAG: hypothetical protein ABSG15_03855 [FCB group bacterium]|jgi:hypothetical protein